MTPLQKSCVRREILATATLGLYDLKGDGLRPMGRSRIPWLDPPTTLLYAHTDQGSRESVEVS